MTSVATTGESIMWFSGWSEPTVNLGRDDDPDDTCNAEAINEDDVCVVQRQGGGGTVFLSPGNEISWSYVTPEDDRADNPATIYNELATTLCEALDELGVEAWHEPVNDIVTNTGKISGGTLRQKNGVVYTGCTLLYDVDLETMFTYLQPQQRKYKEKGYDDVQERVSSINDHVDASFETVKTVLQDHIQQRYEASLSEWRSDEMSRAKRYADKSRQQSPSNL